LYTDECGQHSDDDPHHQHQQQVRACLHQHRTLGTGDHVTASLKLAVLSIILLTNVRTRNKNAPIQLAQCRFPGLPVSNAKMRTYFSNKLYGSNFTRQHSETVIV